MPYNVVNAYRPQVGVTTDVERENLATGRQNAAMAQQASLADRQAQIALAQLQARRDIAKMESGDRRYDTDAQRDIQGSARDRFAHDAAMRSQDLGFQERKLDRELSGRMDQEREATNRALGQTDLQGSWQLRNTEAGQKVPLEALAIQRAQQDREWDAGESERGLKEAENKWYAGLVPQGGMDINDPKTLMAMKLLAARRSGDFSSLEDPIQNAAKNKAIRDYEAGNLSLEDLQAGNYGNTKIQGKGLDQEAMTYIDRVVVPEIKRLADQVVGGRLGSDVVGQRLQSLVSKLADRGYDPEEVQMALAPILDDILPTEGGDLIRNIYRTIPLNMGIRIGRGLDLYTNPGRDIRSGIPGL